MTPFARVIFGLLVLCGALVAPLAHADTKLPRAFEGMEIEDRVGNSIPLDVKLRDQDGRDVTLGDYLKEGAPVIVQLAYYDCPMLCSLVVNGLVDAMKLIKQEVGKDYRVLVVSFDPRDTTEIATKKRNNYLRSFGRDVGGERGWDFTIGEESEVKRLSDSLGFRYRWDEKTEQYVHAAAAFIITPDGRLSRTLYGIQFPAGNLNLALREASLGHLASTVDRVLLFCFHYDPQAGSYVLAGQRLMKAAGFVTVAVLALFLLRMWLRDRRRPRAVEQGS